MRRTITVVCPEDDPGAPPVTSALELPLCQCQCAANDEAGRCDSADLPAWVDPPLTCDGV